MSGIARLTRIAGLTIAVLLPSAAWPAAETIDPGATAWLLTSTALVLFMTLPGLAAFYAGLVRNKNVLSILMQCFAICCVVSVLWLAGGYALAFGNGGGAQAFIGSLDKALFSGVGRDAVTGVLPETVFVMFQMTFAIITPALVIGGFAERMRFSAVLWFSALWLLLVYVPICHWVWGGGWLAQLGVIDFAGGIVVHINAGVCGTRSRTRAGQAARLSVGRNASAQHAADRARCWNAVGRLVRLQCGQRARRERRCRHGHARDASRRRDGRARMDGRGVVALWQTERARHRDRDGGRARDDHSGIRVRRAIGRGRHWSCRRHRLSSRDAIPEAHPADRRFAGRLACARRRRIVGTVLTGVFASAGLGGAGYAEGITMGGQLFVQAVGVGAAIAWCGVATFVILKVLDAVQGLRVAEEQETEGLDLAQHGERGYSD